MDAALGQRRSPRQRLIIALAALPLVILAAVEFYLCVFRYDKDFLWHRTFGVSFLQDRVYESFGRHYLPGRAMIDAATAWLPYRLDRALWLVGGCAALAYSVRFWSQVTANRSVSRGAVAGALLVTGCYVLRDLPECGLQMCLLALLTLALWGLQQGRPAVCGMALGAAVVYKVMPVIFLPYLVWKRQWQAAGWMAAGVVAFCMLPALFLGWQRNIDLHRQWLAFAIATVEADDPSENGVEIPVLRNQSLPLVLARLVQEYPQGHPLAVDNSRLVHLASLDPHTAKRFVQSVLLGLAVVLAWRFRHPGVLPERNQDGPCEWSAVMILVAILSPLCWLQHLVLVIPAAIIVAQRIAAGEARRWQITAATLAAMLALLVHRDLLGIWMCDLLSTLQPHTLASLLVMGAVLGSPLRPAAVAISTPAISADGAVLQHPRRAA